MPKKRFRKILYDFGNLITNMKNDAWVSLIIGFYGMLKTSSKIQTTIDELTFFSEGIGSFVVYPVALVLTFIGFWFCAYLIVQVIGDCFKWASRFHFKKREAKIDFLVHQDGNSVVFEVRNLERQLDIDSVSVFFYTVDQIQDKYGKLPFDHEVFTRNYFGKNHELSEKRELAWRDGGGKKSGHVYIPSRQSVIYHLFDLDEYGDMYIPKMQLRLNKFRKGNYHFTFEFAGYVKKRSVPNWVWMDVTNSGDRIKIENIEWR